MIATPTQTQAADVSRLEPLDHTVLAAIDAFIATHGNSPTYQQIAQWLGHKTRGAATAQWMRRMRAYNEIVITEQATQTPGTCWTRPWVLQQLSARKDLVSA